MKTPIARAVMPVIRPNATVFLIPRRSSEKMSMPPSLTPSQCSEEGGLRG
jgi:hypothetical protein